MRISFLLALILCLLLNGALLYASEPLGSVAGRISVRTARGEIVSEQSIVVLEPKGVEPAKSLNPSRTHKIVMSGKRFTPRFVAARVGDTVEFINRDNFDHNVFSPSQQDEFDLGSYPLGATRSHTFRTTGLSKMYCNVHSKMAAFVLVHEHGWGIVSKTDGWFTFPEVPLGEYTLRIWNVRGEFERSIGVKAGSNALLSLQMEGTAQVNLQHLNKFGESYEEDEEDEIY